MYVFIVCVKSVSENNWQVDDVLDVLQATTTTMRAKVQVKPHAKHIPFGFPASRTRPSLFLKPYWKPTGLNPMTNNNLFPFNFGIGNLGVFNRRFSFQPYNMFKMTLPRAYIQGEPTGHSGTGFIPYKPLNYNTSQRDTTTTCTGHVTTTHPSDATEENDDKNNYSAHEYDIDVRKEPL